MPRLDSRHGSNGIEERRGETVELRGCDHPPAVRRGQRLEKVEITRRRVRDVARHNYRCFPYEAIARDDDAVRAGDGGAHNCMEFANVSGWPEAHAPLTLRGVAGDDPRRDAGVSRLS